MTAPSKTPAEALEALINYGEIHPITGVVYPSGTHKEWIKQAKAAIPVAELHEEMEMWLKLIIENAEIYTNILPSHVSKGRELLDKLEALKCNPQK